MYSGSHQEDERDDCDWTYRRPGGRRGVSAVGAFTSGRGQGYRIRQRLRLFLDVERAVERVYEPQRQAHADGQYEKEGDEENRHPFRPGERVVPQLDRVPGDGLRVCERRFVALPQAANGTEGGRGRSGAITGLVRPELTANRKNPLFEAGVRLGRCVDLAIALGGDRRRGECRADSEEVPIELLEELLAPADQVTTLVVCHRLGVERGGC